MRKAKLFSRKDNSFLRMAGWMMTLLFCTCLSVTNLQAQVAKIGTTEYATLDDAVTAAASATDTIVILQDIAVPRQTIDKNISINLNTHTLSGSTSKLINITAGNVTIKNGTITSNQKYAMHCDGTGIVKLEGCTISCKIQPVRSIKAGGKIYIDDCNITATDAESSTVGIGSYGDMYINNSTITSNGGYGIQFYITSGTTPVLDINNCKIKAQNFGVYCSSSDGGTINIHGNTSITLNGTTGALRAVSVKNRTTNIGGYIKENDELVADGNVTISLLEPPAAGSDYSSYNCGVGAYGGTVNILGNTNITATGEYVTAGVVSRGSGTTNISGGTITADNACIFSGNKAKIAISGGTFNMAGNNANVFYLTGKDTVSVTGGTFAATGTNDTLFNATGNGAVVTIEDITATANTLFNCGAADSIAVNGGTYNVDGNWLVNAGKVYLNGGIFTSDNTTSAVNNGTLKVNKGWYSANMTSNTRSTKKYIARTGSEEPTYKDDAYLVPVDADAVTAASLTGTYYQLGNTITYYSNNSADEKTAQTKPNGETVNLYDYKTFDHAGSTIYRWNTQADGNGTDYALGAAYSADYDLDLYAVWLLNLNMTMDSTDVVCYGENNGTDKVKIIGGEAPFQIVLSSTVMAENDTVKNLMDRTHIFTNLKPGKYNVQLTDVLKKDTIRGTFTIAQPDTLIVESMTVPVKPCPLMGNGVYNVSMTTTGGNGGNHFVWGEDADNVDAMASTVNPGADDRDNTYTVAVKVTDKKGCVATDTTTFAVSPVIADDGTVHANSKLTIDTIRVGIVSGCDTVLRQFGTPHFTSTNPAITEDILDTIYNNIPTAYPDSVFYLGENKVIWTATDTCGHSIRGEQVIIIFHYPCPNVTDVDNNEYPAVRLGCDCWMAENLRTTKYSDGRAISNLMKYESPTHPDAEANFAIYGYLYDWTAALDAEGGVTPDADGNVQGVCPTGWHMPTDLDFANVAGVQGRHNISDLRYNGYWLDGGGNNSTNFSLLPGGFYNDNTARYENILGEAYLWSVNSADPSQPKVFWADCHCYMWQVGDPSANMGASVRCVKD